MQDMGTQDMSPALMKGPQSAPGAPIQGYLSYTRRSEMAGAEGRKHAGVSRPPETQVAYRQARGTLS